MLHGSTEDLADNTLPCAVLTSGEIDLDASPHEEQPLSRLCYEQDLYSGCAALVRLCSATGCQIPCRSMYHSWCCSRIGGTGLSSAWETPELSNRRQSR